MHWGLNDMSVLLSGKIPPSSTLIFDIELMDIKNGPRSHDSFREMDLDDDWKLSKDEVGSVDTLFSQSVPFVGNIAHVCHCCLSPRCR